MARKRAISIDILMQATREYFELECNRDASLFSYVNLASYVSEKTGETITSDSVRRYKEVREYKNEIEENSIFNDQGASVFVFRSLDIDAFIYEAKSIGEMRIALLNRDRYYQSIVENAAKIAEEAKEIKKENAKLKQNVIELQKETETLTEALSESTEKQKKEVKSLEAQVKKLKNIVETYVNEAIAMELLKETGLLQDEDGPSVLNECAVEVMTLSVTDSLTDSLSGKKDSVKIGRESNVIRGLFDGI